MITFKVTADFLFEAENITQALELLAEHFKNISECSDSPLIKSGKISVEPLE